MAQYIDKVAVLAIIEQLKDEAIDMEDKARWFLSAALTRRIEALEVKEVDNVWHEVDNVNLPQPDKNKIYCVLSKNKYLLARVIDHPQDEDLLQWKCTEFPFRCYDMCEGDKYMQIV